MPLVTILFPVKNAEKYIRASMDSVMSQTFADFEVLVMEDHSDDNTLEILKSYTDPRIKIFSSHGFIDNLNAGIRMSAGAFVARMDADDIMRADRLQHQINILHAKPEVVVCASHFRLFSNDYVLDPATVNNTHGSGIIEKPLEAMLLGNIVCHPSVMIRKEFLLKENIVYEHYKHAEDYKLWFEIAKKGGEFYIIPEELLQYRLSKDQVTQHHTADMNLQAIRIKNEILTHLLDTKKINTNSDLHQLYRNMTCLVNENRMDAESMMNFFFNLFYYT